MFYLVYLQQQLEITWLTAAEAVSSFTVQGAQLEIADHNAALALFTSKLNHHAS